ncbi:MAG: hypothetical protein RBU27_03150 [Bacteroidota bacterium]|jgi:hypothetical protein|nr:hypothetical protein [Bacteroidota bacterium]
MRTIHVIISSLLFFSMVTGCGEDEPLTPPDDHVEPEGMALFTGGTRTASIFQGIPTDTLHAFVNVASDLYQVRFLDEDEELFELHDDGKTFGWEIADPSMVEVLQDAGREGTFEFRLRGLATGTTTVQFVILHAGHADYRSGAWPLRVH